MKLPFEILHATRNAFVVATNEGDAYLSPKNAVYLSNHPNAKWEVTTLNMGARTERWVIVYQPTIR